MDFTPASVFYNAFRLNELNTPEYILEIIVKLIWFVSLVAFSQHCFHFPIQ